MRHSHQGSAVLAAIVIQALVAPSVSANTPATAPPLPAPIGSVVNVATEPQLQAAIRGLASNTTIVLAPGTYNLTNTLYVNGTFSNVGIRGATNNRDDVVLAGPGMANVSYGSVPYGVWTGGNIQGVTIANLTIRDVYYHPIVFNRGTESPRVYNVRLLNAGQQFIKSNPDGAGGGVDNGVVEYSIIEYGSTSRDYYTNGVDVHTGANWRIRHNLFRNIVAPAGQMAGPAVLVWNHSSNTVTEGNTFVNCARGIAYGLQDVTGSDHVGGVIRNNTFFRGVGQSGDTAIFVGDSPNTRVLNNTIFMSGTYPNAIEYRFAGTTGVVIANNVLDGVIRARDGATGALVSNHEGTTAGLFVNAAAGDLHLAATATSAIDRGTALPDVTDDWDGELRPQGAGYDIGADERGATTAAYQIAGRITDAATGAAMEGAAVTLGGGRSMTITTDAAGAYVFGGLAGGVNYTVTPSKSGYGFTPGSQFYAALAASQPGTDFRALATASPNRPPTVSMTAPAGAGGYVAPATVGLGASAADADGTIVKVDFYAGTALVGTATSAPYTTSWSGVAAGNYVLTAVATDDDGAATRSTAVTLSVSTPGAAPIPAPVPATTNRPPVVTITAPAGGSVFTAPARITVRATANDPDGRVVRVTFYAGTERIGSDTDGSRYSTSWRRARAGRFTITAVAIDEDGASTTSQPVNIVVR